MDQKEFNSFNGYKQELNETTISSVGKCLQKELRGFCSTKGLYKTAQKRLPILQWLPKYNVRNSAISDLIAGLTLAIYNIPQGMAYSTLASLPPVNGLYAAFFPPLIYFFLGTSFHSSIGVFSITSLMTGVARYQILPDLKNGSTATSFDGINDLTPVDVVNTLAFLVGCIQLFMMFCRLDFLTALLSDAVISAFTFGAGVHAAISQIPTILGITVEKRKDAALVLVYNIHDIANGIHKSNGAVLLISTCAIVYLVLTKLFIKKIWRFKKIPFPVELVLLLIGILISRLLGLHHKWNVKIIQDIPAGISPPRLPVFQLIPHLIQPAFSIAIVAFVITVSMGKLFGRKHDYAIDPNQELCALGAAGLFSSFFCVFPTSCSLSRTLVNESSGAKSQFSGLVSACLVGVFVLWLGPFLEGLPMCILSSIVLVALSSIFSKITDLPAIARTSMYDLIVWILTALAVLFYDLIMGLLIGVAVQLLATVLRNQWSKVDEIGLLPSGDFGEISQYATSKPLRTPILKLQTTLMFVNVERFKKAVLRKVEEFSGSSEKAHNYLIIDCSMWNCIDCQGETAIKELNKQITQLNSTLLMTNARYDIMATLTRSSVSLPGLSIHQFFPSNKDAVEMITPDVLELFQKTEFDNLYDLPRSTFRV